MEKQLQIGIVFTGDMHNFIASDIASFASKTCNLFQVKLEHWSYRS